MLDLDKYKVSIEDLKCKNALDNIDFYQEITCCQFNTTCNL